MKDARLLALGGASVILMALPVLLVGRMAFQPKGASARASSLDYRPYQASEPSGLAAISSGMKPWNPDATLAEIAARWKTAGQEQLQVMEEVLARPNLSAAERVEALKFKAICLNYESRPEEAYKVFQEARTLAEKSPDTARAFLYTLIYFQGVTAMRIGENANCVNCRGISACIVPFNPAAVHRVKDGSQLAVKHFTEYLRQFPEDLEVRWLLTIAHMTLGDGPDKIDPKYRLALDSFLHSKLDIGRFEDIAHKVGLERTNQAGGAIMDDFDNDGDLDIVISSFDPQQAMAYYRNTGDGQFQDVTATSGLAKQLGGLNIRQGDYDNDGLLDIYVPRGAWLPTPIRPSLLRNTGNGVFVDVTKQAGLLEPQNSNSAEWADYDNDGYLDLFVACEQQPNRLYHNQRNGTFKEVAGPAGLLDTTEQLCKSASWIDYDRDRYPDLFVQYLDGMSHLFHNDRNGRFTDVNISMGVDGPMKGFACWAWDYDNDGWEDLFATSYDRTTADIVRGLVGEPHQLQNNRLFRNVGGKRFEDMTAKAGLNMVFATMGSNYGDFDNDGYLDMYLGTGEPNVGTLVPNRMFKNVDGKYFSEITASSGTGQLQKGHAVACGDWDRDGNIDLYAETGGADPSDRYHNLLFQNPGHNNQWITVKLVGKKTNRAAIGARIKLTTADSQPRSIYRHISAGSSFGGNPLLQTVGLGKTGPTVTLEVTWPTSGTTQIFRNLPVNQGIEVTEFATQPKPLPWTKLAPATTARSAAAPAG